MRNIKRLIVLFFICFLVDLFLFLQRLHRVKVNKNIILFIQKKNNYKTKMAPSMNVHYIFIQKIISFL